MAGFCRTLTAAAVAMMLASSAQAQTAPGPVSADQIAIHEIAVDQAAATLIETSCGVIMIDAGGRTDADRDHLMAYLKTFFDARPQLNNTIAAFYLSHAHIDHDFSMMDVAQAYKVRTFIYNGHAPPRGSGTPPIRKMRDFADANQIPIRTISDEKLVRLSARDYTDGDIDPVRCKGVDPKVRVLSGAIGKNPGWSKDDWDDDNNHSLVVRIDFGKASFLFLGDMELPGQKLLNDRFGTTRLLDVDLYHVAHHGAKNGTDKATLTMMTPKLAVMGVGDPTVEDQWAAWGHGHPRKEAVDALLAGVADPRPSVLKAVADGQHAFTDRPIDKAIYATAWDGDIVVTALADGTYTVWTSR